MWTEQALVFSVLNCSIPSILLLIRAPRLCRPAELRTIGGGRCAEGALEGNAEDAGVDAVELAAHPFYIGTLFQPQIGAVSGQPMHPLIRAFIGHCRGSTRST
jgi:hypothetical protein